MSHPEEQQLPPEALLAIQAGRKIEAIKIVREQTGMGLADSKVLVERVWRQSRPGMPRLAPGREDSGLLRLVAVLVIAGAVIAAIFLL
jgi:hypothetical protein